MILSIMFGFTVGGSACAIWFSLLARSRRQREVSEIRLEIQRREALIVQLGSVADQRQGLLRQAAKGVSLERPAESSEFSFILTFTIQAEKNGALVATSETVPMIVAGSDGPELAQRLMAALQSFMARIEALDLTEGKAYLKTLGVDFSAVRAHPHERVTVQFGNKSEAGAVLPSSPRIDRWGRPGGERVTVAVLVGA